MIHWSNMLLYVSIDRSALSPVSDNSFFLYVSWLRGMQLIHKVCHSEEKSLSLLLSPSIPILEKGTSSSGERVTFIRCMYSYPLTWVTRLTCNYSEDALMKANHRSSATGLMQKVLAERGFKPNTRQVLSDTISPNTHRSFHLESSTATLQFASTTHDSLDVIPSASKQLIATLKKTN